MKRLALVGLLLTMGPVPGSAQDRLARADVSATLGWFNANKRGLNEYEDWYNRSLLAEAGFGWYWTDHLKTALTAGASTAATMYGSISEHIGGQPVFGSTRARFSTRRLGITQEYQFGDNQWFHPFLGAGLDLVWEHSSRQDEPIYSYDPVTRQTRLVRPALATPERTHLRALPALSGGFKAYLTPRAFFRSDVRVGFQDTPDEVVVRFGFGVDLGG